MYVRRKEEQHDAVVARAKARHEKRKILQDAGGGGGDTADAATKAANATQFSNKLVVKDKLKEVLCSCLIISDSDADNLCNKICGQGKD